MHDNIMISFKNKKVIVFDLDYTIVKLTADWHTLRSQLNKKYSTVYDETCDFKTMSGCLSKIVEKKDWRQLEEFFKIMRQYELENIEETSLIEETIFFINNKEQFGANTDAKFAIFSLNTRSTILKSLEMAGILGKFEFFVGREDVTEWKPEPEGLLKISDHFKVTTEEMIYFGDLEKDLLAGANAGIESYYIDTLINQVRKKKKS